MALFFFFFFLHLACAPVTRSGTGGGSFLSCRLDRRQIYCRLEKGQGGFNKSARRITHITVEWIRFPLAGRGGEESKNIHCSVMWIVLLYGVPHAADMFAAAYLWPKWWLKFNLHDGGLCNQAPVLGDVMLSSGSSPTASRLLVLVVARRKGESEHLSSDGLGIAWRSLARGGRGAQGPDCVSISCSTVLFVKSKALFSNFRSFWIRIVKGFSVTCTCHVNL